MWLCDRGLAGFDVPHVEFKPRAEILFTFDTDCTTVRCAHVFHPMHTLPVFRALVTPKQTPSVLEIISNLHPSGEWKYPPEPNRIGAERSREQSRYCNVSFGTALIVKLQRYKRQAAIAEAPTMEDTLARLVDDARAVTIRSGPRNNLVLTTPRR